MLLHARALVFDLDGTLVHSIAAVDRAWTWLAKRHGLQPCEVLQKIHGWRAIDSIRLVLPGVDAEAENLLLRQRESTDTAGIVAVEGALALLKDLTPSQWAIVTSGTSDVARARMAAAGIREPSVAVFGEDVVHGKPAPDPFLLAAERLALPPEDCLAFEDTVAGVRSAMAAGMRCVALATTEEASVFNEAIASIRDFTQISIESQGAGFLVHLTR